MLPPPTPNPPEPNRAGAIVDPAGEAALVPQPPTPALPETPEPFVGGFATNLPSPALLSQTVLVAEKLLNESPSLLFVTINFPRHIARKVLPMR
jgi:hypothetical protein